ncbi:MAG TPA: hypothetical protein VGM39_10890 [Kofleriaceae bacterium]|jgi:hypothetical protein
MLPRVLFIVAASMAFGAACGGTEKDVDEPQTAREKLRAEAKKDKDDDDTTDPKAKPWGKWRYSGDRTSCFYRVGPRCYETEKKACAAAKCSKDNCEIEGAAPAHVSCSK